MCRVHVGQWIPRPPEKNIVKTGGKLYPYLIKNVKMLTVSDSMTKEELHKYLLKIFAGKPGRYFAKKPPTLGKILDFEIKPKKKEGVG